jgi:hypothetical protein
MTAWPTGVGVLSDDCPNASVAANKQDKVKSEVPALRMTSRSAGIAGKRFLRSIPLIRENKLEVR